MGNERPVVFYILIAFLIVSMSFFLVIVCLAVFLRLRRTAGGSGRGSHA